MDNIVEIEGSDLDFLAHVINTCQETGTALRLTTGTSENGNFFKVARGQGMWTAPFYTEQK